MKMTYHSLFKRFSSLVLALILLAVLGLSLTLAQGGDYTIFQVSFSAPDRHSDFVSISADGTRMVFESDADHLGQGIPSGQHEVWLFDATTMTYTRITTATNPPNWWEDSLGASLSADGTTVAFESDATFLGSGNGGVYEIVLYDTEAMTYTRVTSASALDRDSEKPAINADGTKVAFQSNSDFLSQGIPTTTTEIWLYAYDDTMTTVTRTRVTAASGANRRSQRPAINADGTKIVFQSDSDLLGQGLLLDQVEIWLYDTATMAVTRITTSTRGSNDRDNEEPDISADGTKIVFHSDFDHLGGDNATNNAWDIWLYDTVAMTYTRITTASDAARDSLYPSISGDGTKIVFESDSQLAGATIADDAYEIWMYDLTTMEYTRLTTGAVATLSNTRPDVNDNGDYIAFARGNPVTDHWDVWLAGKSLSLAITKTVAPAMTVGPGHAVTYTVAYDVQGGAGLQAVNMLITDVMPVSLTNYNYTSSGAVITPTGSASYVWQVQNLKAGDSGVITVTAEVSPNLAMDTVIANTARIGGSIGEAQDSASLTVDATPPDVPVLLSPMNGTMTSTTELPLSWNASAGAAGYMVNFNGTMVDVATAIMSATGVLTDGVYTWTVAAYDALGNTSAYAGAWTFRVDTAAPSAAITANPTDPSSSADAIFAFSGDDGSGSGVASFECQIDGGAWMTCTSPQAYTGLSNGSHTFQVRAIDGAGNVGTPASYTWEIGTGAPNVPVLVSPADGTVTSTTELTLTWTASVSATGYWLNFNGTIIDMGAMTDYAVGPLGDGVYTWTVAAYDALSNTSTYAGVWQFEVDTTPPGSPNLNITKSVAGAGNGTTGLPLSGVVTYTIVLSNSGNAAATGVVMADEIPSGVSFGNWIQQNGAQRNGTVVSWTGDIAEGSEIIVSFTAAIGSGSALWGQTITNTAAFTSTNAGTGRAEAGFSVESGGGTMWFVYLPVVMK